MIKPKPDTKICQGCGKQIIRFQGGWFHYNSTADALNLECWVNTKPIPDNALRVTDEKLTSFSIIILYECSTCGNNEKVFAGWTEKHSWVSRKELRFCKCGVWNWKIIDTYPAYILRVFDEVRK